ncbi:MAG: hypothetical protein NTX15_04860 [Candidatus Kapabacteria bacterium]|nr:hypothetical protein [Candidatus Kapabacteria bacterium]
MNTDRPNLDRARAFTRSVGPIGIAVGLAISIQGLLLLPSPVAAFQPLAYGLVVLLFGWAAYARTESVPGRIAQWCVTLVFVGGGVWSLMQWIPLLWGPHTASSGENLSLIALWLTAGPALLVPGVLAAFRPGWTPLIVVPALLSLTFAAMIGYGALYLLGLPDGTILMAMERAQLVGVSAFSMIFLATAGYRAIVLWRS